VIRDNGKAFCDECGARIATSLHTRLCEWCVAAEAYAKRRHAARAHVDAIAALDALGVAVATVARATLIARVAIGRTVTVHDEVDGVERGLELWQRGASLCLSEYARNRAPRRLWQIGGQPEDNAAEAVARLIELVEERTR
jgi:hypothetical protein